MVTTEIQMLQLKIAQALQDFWEFYTGVRPERTIIVVDQQAIVALLRDVLTPAEVRLAHTEVGWLTLQKYGKRVLEQAEAHLQQLVAEVVEQEVNLVVFNLDVTTGSILIFFQRSVGILS
jgi:uncharacterized protein YbcI